MIITVVWSECFDFRFEEEEIGDENLTLLGEGEDNLASS